MIKNLEKIDFLNMPLSFYIYFNDLKAYVNYRNLNKRYDKRISKPSIDKVHQFVSDYFSNNPVFILLLENCRRTINNLYDKDNNSLVNFYTKKLDNLEEEIYTEILKDSLTVLAEEQFQNRLNSIRGELKYVYDSSYNQEIIKEANSYFYDPKVSMEVLKIVDKLNNGVNFVDLELKEKRIMFKYHDELNNNFLHFIMAYGKDEVIVDLLKNQDVLKYLLQINKNELCPLDSLVKLKRFFVFEELENIDNKMLKGLIFRATIRGLKYTDNSDDFEYLCQKAFYELDEVELYTDSFDALRTLLEILNNNSFSYEQKEMMEELIIVIASYKKNLVKEIEEIENRYPNVDLKRIIQKS